MKTIRIAFDKEMHELSLDDLLIMQGNLKDLSAEDYEKIKKEIIETGFAFPIHIWKKPTGEKSVIGGTQRTLSLRRMRDQEGYVIPPLPVVIVHAKNEKEARRRILQDASQYGEITRQGLYKFMDEADIGMAEMRDSFRMPDIDFDAFDLEFFKEKFEMEDVLREDLNKKFILEIQFPNELEMADIRDDLTSRGYIVKEVC